MTIEFTEEFLSSVKDRPFEVVLQIHDEVLYIKESGTDWTSDDYQFLIRAFALLRAMGQQSLLDPALFDRAPRVTGEMIDCVSIAEFIGELAEPVRKRVAQAQLEKLERAMGLGLGVGFAYEFSQGDLDRVQTLVNELRALITTSDKFEAKHQRRLLMRLEKLQAELHKRMSDLDHLWGLVGDAGVAVGKFGKDAKPIFDRIREITHITWRTQARAEELPSDAPLPQLEDQRNEVNDEAEERG